MEKDEWREYTINRLFEEHLEDLLIYAFCLAQDYTIAQRLVAETQLKFLQKPEQELKEKTTYSAILVELKLQWLNKPVN